jgi:hypothetical protein
MCFALAYDIMSNNHQTCTVFWILDDDLAPIKLSFLFYFNEMSRLRPGPLILWVLVPKFISGRGVF